jgi:acyl-CoA oxidase
MINCFIDAVQKVEQSDLKAILKSLCDLFVLFNVQKNLAIFLESGYFTGTHSQWIRAKVRELNKLIRSQAVPLVDSFNLSDFFIRSPLGRYDGTF